MKNIEVGNLVRFSYSNGKSALGIVTWEEGDSFKALWSDGSSSYRGNNYNLSKSVCITGVWEVIDYTEEDTKTSKIKVGQIVTWGRENAVGYVIAVKGYSYQAIWSDEVPYEEEEPNFLAMDSSFLTGVYDVVIHPKEDKLTIAQEASNNAFMAVQGILQALSEKNGETIKPSFTSRMFSREEWEASYELGRQDGISEGFTFSDFDTSVKRTWKDQSFKDAITNASLGLTGESGEVADLIKKAIYHGRGFYDKDLPSSEKSIKIDDVKDELSDVLFYVSAMAQEFGFTLEDIARHNKEKLEKRYEKGFTVEESAQKRDKLDVPETRNLRGCTQLNGGIQ